MAQGTTEEVEKEPLDKELQHTLEEARTVIPGLQALFGFQLIVPFHPTFKQLDVAGDPRGGARVVARGSRHSFAGGARD